MSSVSRLTAPLAGASEWLEAHPVAYFLALVAAPVAARLVIAVFTSEGLREAALSGLVFGVVFATVTLALRRFVGR
ncbi:hypothetical protein ACFQMA_19800 [Halosimplex aquaticum]|uniref:Uncharacterized protein n=1 Tax=Halosimplex aquaticum TaxID=3026162 RepID=A0ABD5Y5B1_9EURY|nr:hypothetical protein [Halosimplex aquaticum]